VAGVANGTPIEATCLADLGGYRINSNDSWGLNCDAESVSVTLWIPHQEAGPIQITLMQNDFGDLPQLRVSDDTSSVSGSLTSSNFESGTITGTLEQPSTEVTVLQGGFEASWSIGNADCTGCAPMTVTANFRAVFDF
jgi:hypothetical protein